MTSISRVSALLLSFLLFPGFVFASSTFDFSNSGGTITGSSAGMILSGSTIIAVTGFSGNSPEFGSNLGTLSFSTLPLTSGSLQGGGTFGDGGSFTVTMNGNGNNGPSGAVFAGSFNGPVTWTLVTLANGTHNYTLTGVVTGSMGGENVTGVTVQLTINTGKGYFNGSAAVAGGNTAFVNSVPEPSTLALFGTGIFGLAGVLRKRALARA